LVHEIASLLPFSFAFAAGAMLSLVALELAREAFTRRTLRLWLAGALVMLTLAALVGV
jgi:zinc transporter ZupT